MILTPYDTCASARGQAQRHTRRQRGPGLKHVPDVNITCLPWILRGPHVIFPVRRRTFRMAKANPSIDLRITQFVSHRAESDPGTIRRLTASRNCASIRPCGPARPTARHRPCGAGPS